LFSVMAARANSRQWGCYSRCSRSGVIRVELNAGGTRGREGVCRSAQVDTDALAHHHRKLLLFALIRTQLFAGIAQPRHSFCEGGPQEKQEATLT
jgi:hypothetical protein